MSTTYGYTKQVESNQQGSKHTRAISPKKGTYVRRLTKPASLVHEHMFIGHRTYVHRPSNICSPKSPLFGSLDVGRNHVIVELNDRSEMNTGHGYRKQVESHHQGSKHTLASLMSKLRSSLGAAWEQPGSSLEYAYSMLMTTFLRPFSSKRAELERRLASDEITARPSRTYGSRVTSLRLAVSMLLLLIVGTGNVWGQTDYSGTYYIASDYKSGSTYQYDPNNLNNNYYLCPSDGWIYYKKENKWIADEASSDGPFLTTFKCRTDEYITYGGMNNATWVISKHGDYYAFYHTGTNKHMVLSGQISGCGADRMRVHLEEISSPETPGENALFAIVTQDKSLSIAPSTILDDRLTVNGGNKDALTGQSGKTGGPKGTGYNYENTAGIVGIYRSTGTDDNRYFYLEEVFDRPTFTSTSSQIVIGHSKGNNATIYYTIDGTNPTTTNYARSGAAPLQIDMPENAVTLKAIAVINDLPSCISSIQVVPNATITLAEATLTYNGTAQTIGVTSVTDGETPIANSKYNVTYSNNTNAGTATVNIKDIADDDLIVYGSTTFTINKKDLTITANNHTISYGDAPADNGVTCEGFVNSETIAVLEGTLEYAYNYEQYGNVGNYTITPSGLTSTNYNITYHTGTLTVEQKEVGLTWSETTSFPYDGTSHGLTATATGMVNGDEIGVTVTGAQISGGNHTATASALTGTKAGNYKLPAENSHVFTIIPAQLTVTANNHTITYGDAPEGNGVTYSGFIGTEDESVLGGTLDYDFSYTQYGDVGNTYTITPKGVASNNYNITFTLGSLAVTPKTVGIDWTDIEFIYNGSEQVPNATATGMVNSDDIGITVTGAQTNAGNYTATASALTGNKKDNYKLPNGITQTFTISPKSLGDGTTAAEGITVEMTDDGSLSAVKDGSTTLTENTDYTQETEEEGSDKIITITGKGNYTGIVRGIYASPAFVDPDGVGSGQAAAVYQTKRDLSCPSGINPYIIRKVNPSIGTAVITKLDYIPEDVPVLLLSDDEVSGFVASPKDPSTPDVTAQTKNSNLLKVSAGGETVGAAQIYMFYKGEFVLTKAGTLGEGKFYLYNPNYTTTPTSGDSGGSEARGSLQFFIDDEETTEITELENATTKKQDTDIWYTLDGRRLSVKPTKAGIYIHQGQKEYIKR